MKAVSWFVCGVILAVPTGPVLAVPDSSAKPLLEGLIGKTQVIGISERGGSRFLGRVLSGDHGLYIVQTFHYVSAPATASETVPETAYVRGRNGRMRLQTKQVKAQYKTQTAIADDTAVRALLSGVAGPGFKPGEQPAQREMVAPADVLCLQQLSPPPAGKPQWTMKTLWPAPPPAATKAQD